ncbi:type VI secretion system-associated protein TagF [Endozoicomonas lisbonensis]|uniref:Type VI secretion system protein ImpM n=1 Tax=Endozoicomonas lisbonensis TaxID=3120522 RepID=A0ABV2SAP1_9GAMM
MRATGARRCGFYGKLPAHGDFIDRDLPVSFINLWDPWLQQCLAASRERCREQWLDVYLTSPVWRFVLSAGVIDGKARAGLLVPSVDAVGRYFPLTLAVSLRENEQPAGFLANNGKVFDVWEQVALRALQEQLTAEQVAEQLAQGSVIENAVQGAASQTALVRGLAQPLEPLNPWANLLDASMSQQPDSFSLWCCNGSVAMPPMLLCRKGLPDPVRFSAMLNGQWQAEGWEWLAG